MVTGENTFQAQKTNSWKTTASLLSKRYPYLG